MLRSHEVPFVVVITMTPRVAEQLLRDFTPEQRKVIEKAAEAFVRSIKDDGGLVY